ncbi:MAG: 2OG-Fe(II) oxygenase [Acidobacteriaceae bacterium]|jgi:SM-20-related protein|nr:2OG-Fe(II) oxygenase [Acidobacteriaceae bacterium]
MSTAKVAGVLSQHVLSDENVLSTAERDLISRLIARARISAQTNDRPLPQSIARLAGEIIAERMYKNLGADIERLLLELDSEFSDLSIPIQVGAGSPPSPSPMQVPRNPGPTPPAISSVVRMGPGSPTPTPPVQVPRTPGPNPGASTAMNFEGRRPSTRDLPEVLTAQCVLFEEFLAPEELNNLMQDTFQREMDFEISEVISPGLTAGAVDFECRRSRVLMDAGAHRDVILNRIQSCLARVVEKLGLQPFSPTHAEVQITASNHGDYFRCHSDNGHENLNSRELTFVYFFHREPKRFQGGELRLYDSRWENGAYVATENYRAIMPRQNQIVLFPSSLLHEITPIDSSAKAFADSRFTVNGWLHR